MHCRLNASGKTQAGLSSHCGTLGMNGRCFCKLRKTQLGGLQCVKWVVCDEALVGAVPLCCLAPWHGCGQPFELSEEWLKASRTETHLVPPESWMHIIWAPHMRCSRHSHHPP